ncbi:hypothetical protein EG028_20505 [Chitinophaga barathri]|uniref:Uncharacterized protein n=2 Tax=Chitinophaga barathri TaxID=1647451 RepID=A0A3N4M7Z5_9BACT|nr:hypothetical protein EG028_20505 [Chitinophaga barathri]
MTSLLKRSIQEELPLEDYSVIYYKMQIAHNFMQGGIINSHDHTPNLNYLMSYPDTLAFFELYNEALNTDERFNGIEIHFDRDMNTNAVFTWDQAYYDEDVEGNAKPGKKH